MSMDTVIHAGMARYAHAATGLVLMGGGARTAYQAGVLQALGTMLRLQPGASKAFPFQVLVGTSAGAINATLLASWSRSGLDAFDRLAQFCLQLRSDDVYRLNVPRWVRFSRIAAAWQLARNMREQGAILDNSPLVSTLHRHLSLPGIEEAIRLGTLNALAVTASSYSSGTHWTFCQTEKDAPFEGWERPGRKAEFTPITVEHLLASSAIPFLFPSTSLWVAGRRESFGDGSMRQTSPLSSAMHLGARKILAIGVGQSERSAMGQGSSSAGNTLGSIVGHTMASVFHDTLHADVEQTRRVTHAIRQLPREAARALPYKTIEVMAISPSQSLDALAQQHLDALPEATRAALSGLGILKGGGGVLASYILFEPGFVQAVRALGESDAFARKAELMDFLG
jgi:NTE family protein